MATADGLTRRSFLTAAGAVPLGRVLSLRQPPGAAPAVADVVVVAGDPAAYAAVFRLAQDPAVRVVLVEETLPWARMNGPAEDAAVADLPPFARGHQACFDGWRDRGNQGWGFADVLPAFRRIETYEAGASETRGGAGPLSVKHCWDPHAAHRAFLMAAGPAGFRQDSRHDFNGPRSQSVAGYYQKAILDDRPHTLTAAFLAPVRIKPTVSVLSGGYVSRIVMERGRAVGVEYFVGGARQVIRAQRAVIVGASPARAAQLLMLSGIGPADQLRAVGVPVVMDRAGVGGNLHDQMRLALRYASLQELPASTVTAGMFTVSLHASPPDLQMDLVTPRAGGPQELTLDVTLVRPSSRGALTLTSADPTEAPRLSLNTLATDADVTALVQGLRLGRMLMTGSALDPFRGAEAASTADALTAAALPGLVRDVARPRGHLAGTCAMGPAADRMAVVDATLAVHGVTGLHVAGAAVMPDIVNAPPEAAALMIGDRCAELIAGPGRPPGR
jgi:choline dehydrogenase